MAMRLGAATFLLIFLAPALLSETPLSDVKKITYQVKVFNWSFTKNVWSEGQTIKVIRETFDAQGRLVSSELYGGQNDLLEKTSVAYDGVAAVKSVMGPDDKKRRTAEVIREGNVETETVHLPDGRVLYIDVNTYDPRGALRESLHFNAAGELEFRKIYTDDEKENLAAVDVFNPDGAQALKITYVYRAFDARGNWTTREEYYSYGDVWRRPHEIVHRTLESRRGHD